MSADKEHDTSRVAGPLKRRRRALLAGAFGLTLLGLAAGEPLLLPGTIPVFAQQGTQPSQAQPTPAQPGNGNLITVERPQNAPASFAPIVSTVRPAVVSVRVDIGSGEVSGRGGAESLLPDLPDDHPLNRWFRRFGEV